MKRQSIKTDHINQSKRNAMPGKKVAILFLSMSSLVFYSCHRPDNLFINLPSSKTHIDFANNLEKRNLFNILYFLYYYNGGGVAVGDINNDGLPDMYFTANSLGHNKLYLNKGNFEFEDITEKAGVAGRSDRWNGVSMVVLNPDGFFNTFFFAVPSEHDFPLPKELFFNNSI